MQDISQDARAIINIVKNVGSPGGFVPADHTKILFQRQPNDWVAAMGELERAGLIRTNPRGEIALTLAGLQLR